MSFKYFLEQQQLNPNRKFHIFFVGKYRPFHNAHKYTYDYLQDLINKYNLNGTVYVCTRLKDDEFLTAEQQQKIIELSGIPKEHIINYGGGYNIKTLLSEANGTEEDVVITAFSEKDLDDKSKVGLITPPKDNIMSWKKINNIDHIVYLRPMGYIHKEYADRGVEDKKRQKGTGYVIVVPTQKMGEINISSSLIRQKILEQDWDYISKIVVNQEVLKYLKKIKEKK